MAGSIIDAYELKDIEIAPNKLLLDPENPRIVLKTERAVSYTPQQLASPEIQDYILSVIDKAEFHVADLLESIERDGFLDHGNRMILERVDGTASYLVLEGNRRLTAIKHLLRDQESLSPHVLDSLGTLKAQELVLTGKGGYQREEVVFKLLGMLHLEGQLDWGAMERAFYIYRAYMFEYGKYYDSGFWYDVDCSRECGKTLDMKPRSVRTELAAYRVYAQLREEGYTVKEDHYSLISLAVRTRGLNYEYFELDDESLELSNKGLERFNLLCLDDERPVHNPGDFKNVAKVFREGTPYEMELIETGALPLDGIVERLDNRLARGEFKRELEKIESQMLSLSVSAATGSGRERQLVLSIRDVANRILRSLG